jgi:hypothetical protein
LDRLKCDEAPEEPSTVTIEKVLKIECNISATTNYMHTGIKDVCAFFVLGLVFAYAHTGNELSIGEELSFAWASSSLQSDVTSLAPTELPDGAHGSFCMETRYWKEGQDHGEHKLLLVLPHVSRSPSAK